jgi:hypothetical protein
MTKLIAKRKKETHIYYFRGTKIDVQSIFFLIFAVHVFCPAGTQEKFRTFCRTDCMQNIIAICHKASPISIDGKMDYRQEKLTMFQGLHESSY